MQTGLPPRNWRGHEDTVAVIAVEPSGATVATGGMDGTIRLWDIETGASRGTLEGPTEGIEFLQWHPKGSILLAGCEDMTAWMFNAEKQQCMQVFSGHTGPVVAGASTCALHQERVPCLNGPFILLVQWLRPFRLFSCM